MKITEPWNHDYYSNCGLIMAKCRRLILTFDWASMIFPFFFK